MAGDPDGGELRPSGISFFFSFTRFHVIFMLQNVRHKHGDNCSLGRPDFCRSLQHGFLGAKFSPHSYFINKCMNVSYRYSLAKVFTYVPVYGGYYGV